MGWEQCKEYVCMYRAEQMTTKRMRWGSNKREKEKERQGGGIKKLTKKAIEQTSK